jgi:16S rRNA (guanine527-N7)-methyltransferase
MIESTIIYKYFPDVTEEQKGQFDRLHSIYTEWNSKINVISRKDMDNFYMHHALHSLAIARFPFPDGAKVLDVGTGGGFPGIPLAIMFPNVHFTLCDSIGKKIKVATEVANELGLKNVTTVCSRVEALPDTYDYIVSRAVTELKNFIPWVKGKYTTEMIFLKGGDTNMEISECARSLKLSQKLFNSMNISDFFSEEYFGEKRIIFVKKFG